MRPEVVLVDVGMPGMDGYETARRLRQSLGPTVRLIAITGYAANRQHALAAGFNDFLVKPASPGVIARLVRPPPPGEATPTANSAHTCTSVVGRAVAVPEGLSDGDREDEGGDLFQTKNRVDVILVDGVAWHRGGLSFGGLLGDGEPPCCLDGKQAEDPIAASARKEHADGS